MPRGGPRPGAGAPKGNLNALKHGLHSRQFRQLVEELAANPRLRAVLARFAQRAARRQTALAKEQAAALAVAAWLRYTHALEQGQPWHGPTPLPPFSMRRARIFARYLASEAIKQGLVHPVPATAKWEDKS